jgi:catechol 2,3-dioxygenase-like lactoylglutathione lyase family enzyme
MQITNVDIGLVSATRKLVDFYDRVLDEDALEPRHLPMGTVYRLPCGPVTLKILVPSTTPAADTLDPQLWDRSGLRYITLWTDDLEGLAGRWVEAGGEIVLAPIELRAGVRTALLADPDGNNVEAMQQKQ